MRAEAVARVLLALTHKGRALEAPLATALCDALTNVAPQMTPSDVAVALHSSVTLQLPVQEELSSALLAAAQRLSPAMDERSRRTCVLALQKLGLPTEGVDSTVTQHVVRQ